MALDATWGDVDPPTAALTGGKATVMASLDREVTPPQTAQIVARAGDATGRSAKLCVQAPPFVKDATAVVPAVGLVAGGGKFGWADQVIAEPDVVRDAAGMYRMYFLGVGASMPGVGTATSLDGKTFTADARVLLSMTGADFGRMSAIDSPVTFRREGAVELAFGASTDPRDSARRRRARPDRVARRRDGLFERAAAPQGRRLRLLRGRRGHALGRRDTASSDRPRRGSSSSPPSATRA